MFNNSPISESDLHVLVSDTLNSKFSNLKVEVETSTLISKLIASSKQIFALDPSVDAQATVVNLVNTNTQIAQIIETSLIIENNPGDSQALTPPALDVTPVYQFGINISLNALSTAVRNRIVKAFNSQFSTNYAPTDFTFTTVPTKEGFQCAYLLNNANIYIRVDFNTYYGGATTQLSSFDQNTVTANNTDIVYTGTGIMGNDIYTLGSLNVRKRCNVAVVDPTIYQQTTVFVPIIFVDNIPYVTFGGPETTPIGLVDSNDNPINPLFFISPTFYIDDNGDLVTNISSNNYLYSSITNPSGQISLTSESVSNSGGAINLCNKNILVTQATGFAIYEYATGNNILLDSSGYPYSTVNNFNPYYVYLAGVVTDVDGSCLPVYLYDETPFGAETNVNGLFNTNIPNNTTYRYTLLNVADDSPVTNNTIPNIDNWSVVSTTVPNLLSANVSPTDSVYSKLCKSESYGGIKDFTAIVQINDEDLSANMLNINFIAANAKDAYYNNIQIDMTSVLTSYFDPNNIGNPIPTLYWDWIQIAIIGVDSNGYAKLGIICQFYGDVAINLEALLTLDNNFQPDGFFAINKTYNDGTTPTNYRQSNYILNPAIIAGTNTYILIAVERNADLTNTGWAVDGTNLLYGYYAISEINGVLYLIAINQDDNPTVINFSTQLNGNINNTLVSRLVPQKGDEPLTPVPAPNV